MIVSEINFLRIENKKLRQYLYLFECEIEFTQRILEIKQNFSDPNDVNHLISPLIDRLEKISSEKINLKKELQLK